MHPACPVKPMPCRIAGVVCSIDWIVAYVASGERVPGGLSEAETAGKREETSGSGMTGVEPPSHPEGFVIESS